MMRQLHRLASHVRSPTATCHSRARLRGQTRTVDILLDVRVVRILRAQVGAAEAPHQALQVPVVVLHRRQRSCWGKDRVIIASTIGCKFL